MRARSRLHFEMFACAFAACALAPRAASAEPPSVTVDPNAAALPSSDFTGAVPPPPRITYLQYGVAFTAELATGLSAFCDDPQLDCILGSGGGIAGRVGWRNAGNWYLGGAYELTKQDPTKLMRLALLQQLRFEARRYDIFDFIYPTRGYATQPVLVVSGGLAGYGNEFSITTWGGTAYAGLGVESQVQNGPIIAVTIGWRSLFLQRFTDTIGHDHGPGLANLIAIEVSLEARDAL